MNTNTQDVVQALQMMSGKTDASYAPNPFRKAAASPLGQASDASVMPTAPVPEHVQETLSSTVEHRTGISILVGITYKSLSGNEKDRDFLIRRVVHSKNEMYLDGLAMDIRAPRLIKVSHIARIRDIGAGRIYDNPYKFIQDKLGVAVADELLPEQLKPFAEVIKRMHNEVAVLMYVVALDGIREKIERSAVAAYVKKQTQDLSYDDEELDDYLISIAPDSESAGMAFQRILVKDKTAIQSFMEAMISVIMSNGGADPKQRIFLAKVMDLLEQQGFELSLGI